MTDCWKVDSVMECARELKCDNLLIITWNYEGVIEKDGLTINIIPYYKWCRPNR
ncbi:MAG: hypothetical protein J5965_14750 [Aeriscardovia sp.]|nr:hypothetical protein [Aeriscardovia sp.]